MNCLEFRRRCLADPGHQSEDFLRHRRECESCEVFAAGTERLEARLVDALRVDIPEGLARRIKRRQQDGIAGRASRRLFSMAASILVTLVSAGGIAYLALQPPPIQAAVKKHIEKEWEAVVRSEMMDAEATAAVLSNIGGVIRDDAGTLIHASLCDFSEYGSAHLVLEGRKGPVLVLLMKQQQVPGARFMAITMPEGTRLEGMITLTSNGSMAIVGNSGENLQAAANFIRDSVFWTL